MKFHLLTLSISLLFAGACQAQQSEAKTNLKKDAMQEVPLSKSDREWREILSPEQYYILRQAGTERPHTGEYNLHFVDGQYRCAGCEAALFTSDQKFESHCGWPSFDEALPGAIIEREDRSHGMIRTEVLCAQCGGHLGHLFDDGPTASGMRYCINSGALGFEAQKEEK